MGDALLGIYPARPARLPGYSRAFLHESRRRWGSPDRPCPILGLEEGGECWGIAYAVPPEDEARIAKCLARREGGDERRREIQAVETPDGPIRAWVYVSAKRKHPEEAAGLEARLRSAHGVVGNGAEYVRTLVHALELHDLRDPMVDSLWERLRG
jgi:cation transport protein ChaC